MSSRAIILCLILSVSIHCFSQRFIIFQTWDEDSLMAVLPGQAAEERVNTLNNLSVSMFFKDPELSKKYAGEAMELAVNIHNEKGIADAYRNYGYIEQYKGNFPEALKNYFEALAIYERLNDKHTVAWICYDIGKTHYLSRNYDKAFEYGFLALDKFRERLPDGKTVGTSRDIINVVAAAGEVYTSAGIPDKALKMRLEYYGWLKEQNFPDNTELMVSCWIIGDSYLSAGNYDSAKYYLYRSLAFPVGNINMKAQTCRVMMRLGDLYFLTGVTDSTLAYYTRCYKWYCESGFLTWAMQASIVLGDIYSNLGDIERAESQYLQSERLFNEMVMRKSWYRHDSLKYVAVLGYEIYFPMSVSFYDEHKWYCAQQTYSGLYDINKKRNKANEALHYYILFTNARDSLHQMHRVWETIGMQTRYESEQKERQIQQLSEQNAFKAYKIRQFRMFLFGLAGLITLVILLAIALIRQGRLQEKQNSLILQQKLFRSQMNPHFIFNSLSSIHHFMIDEKPAIAASYLSKFSKLIRNILQGSMEEYIILSNEVGIIDNYLELQKLRFPGKFDFTIEMEDALDPDHIRIPSMITQPFVENAIEHGIRYKEQKGKVSVTFKQINDMVSIAVEDDGIGREKARQLQSERDKDHHSLATSLITDRIRALNRALKKKITLDILDLKDDKGEPAGTRVLIMVPFF